MESSTQLSGSPKPFRLFDLPQELQDAVFAFAYGEPDTSEPVRIKLKWMWEKQEIARRGSERSNYVPKPFPLLQVEQWLVSRRFFMAAARAWMVAHTPSFMAHMPGICITAADQMIFDGFGLYIETVVHTSVDLRGHRSDELVSRLARDIPACKHLQQLELVLDEIFFSELTTKHVCEDELEEENLGFVFESRNMMILSGIGGIALRARPNEFKNNRARQATRHAQCLALGAVHAQEVVRLAAALAASS